MCRIGQGPFWFLIHVNRSNFNEDMCENHFFYIFVLSDLDLNF